MTLRHGAATILGLVAALLFEPSGALGQTKTVVTLSDTARPAVLKVIHREGSVTIVGRNRPDIMIERHPSGPRRAASSPADDKALGLRQLTNPRDIVIQENNNDVIVGTSPRGFASDLMIEVPTRINLNLAVWSGGPITVSAVEGEIEVHNQGNSIVLNAVSGSVMAYAHGGSVKATMLQVTPGKPMAFTAFDGDVDLTIPETTKATLKMHTDKDIFTGFDIQPSGSPSAAARQQGSADRHPREQTVEGSLNGGGPLFELRTFNANIYLRKRATP